MVIYHGRIRQKSPKEQIPEDRCQVIQAPWPVFSSPGVRGHIFQLFQKGHAQTLGDQLT